MSSAGKAAWTAVAVLGFVCVVAASYLITRSGATWGGWVLVGAAVLASVVGLLVLGRRGQSAPVRRRQRDLAAQRRAPMGTVFMPAARTQGQEAVPGSVQTEVAAAPVIASPVIASPVIAAPVAAPSVTAAPMIAPSMIAPPVAQAPMAQAPMAVPPALMAPPSMAPEAITPLPVAPSAPMEPALGFAPIEPAATGAEYRPLASGFLARDTFDNNPFEDLDTGEISQELISGLLGPLADLDEHTGNPFHTHTPVPRAMPEDKVLDTPLPQALLKVTAQKVSEPQDLFSFQGDPLLDELDDIDEGALFRHQNSSADLLSGLPPEQQLAMLQEAVKADELSHEIDLNKFRSQIPGLTDK